jgi:hypothetical protein
VRLSVYPIVARQRLGKHAPAATKNWRRFLCGPCQESRRFLPELVTYFLVT